MFKKDKCLVDLYFKLKMEELKLNEVRMATMFPYFRESTDMESIVDYIESYTGGLSHVEISKVATTTAKANRLKKLIVSDLIKALELINKLKHDYKGISLLASYGLTKKFRYLKQSVTITFQDSNKSLIYSLSEKNKKHVMMTFDTPKEMEKELLVNNFNRILEFDFKEIIKILEERKAEAKIKLEAGN